MASSFKELFSYKSFCIFWCVRFLGISAYQILTVAVAWQLYDITSSALDLGLFGLFQFLPALIFALPAGQAVDRYNRVHIVTLCLIVQAGVGACLYLTTVQDFISRDIIFLMALFLGLTRSFQMPAQQSLTPSLVPRKILQNAVAFSSTGMHTAIIVGPAIGGFLYFLGPDVVYLICTALILSSVILTFFIRYQHKKVTTKINVKELFAGINFIWRNKTLLGAISLDLFAVLLGGATALLPIYAKDILNVGPEGLGMLRAAPALGALICALFIAQWPMKKKVGKKLFFAVGVFGISMLVFGISTSFILSLVALVLAGAADSFSVVIRMTLIQLETPDTMRGRVSSVNAIFIGASNELGEFESGATAELFGPVGSIVLGSIGTILVVLVWAKIFPTLLNREKL
ncbi:MAG: MFS transporter [Burkholderiaceae bacterium]